MEFYISRFKGIEKHDYELEVITPMFLSGAVQNVAELRSASIKAMLRFWWRATYIGSDIKQMLEEESEVFGSTESKSKIKVQLEPILAIDAILDLSGGKTYQVQSSRSPRPFTLNIIDYLAYGVCEYKRTESRIRYKRPFIKPGTTLKMTLQWQAVHTSGIEKALESFIRFGGVGSKSRNGFGCLNLMKKSTIKVVNIEDYNNVAPRAFTSFSNQSKLLTFNPVSTWQDAISDVGLAYREARLSLEGKHSFSKRALVAMPIIAQNERIPNEIKVGRQAKTYFLHVNKLPDGKFQGQILFLPFQSPKADYQDVNKKMIGKIEKIIINVRGVN